MNSDALHTLAQFFLFAARGLFYLLLAVALLVVVYIFARVIALGVYTSRKNAAGTRSRNHRGD